MVGGAFSVLDLSIASIAYALNEDSHITVKCVFKAGVEGVPVDVLNPSFSLLHDENPVDLVSNVLLPLQKEYPEDSEDGVGKYITTFLSNGLTAGTYIARFSGMYNGSPLTVDGTMVLAAVNRAQWFIEALRAQLADKWIFEVPHNYLLHPDKHFWEDGELFAYLQRAVDDVNMTDPVTPQEFQLSNVPCTSFVLLGGQFYALVSKAIKEGVNYYDANFEVRVVVNKQEKFMSIATFFKDLYIMGLQRWKKNYMFNEGDILRAVCGLRTPSVVLRPLSMEYGYHTILPPT